MQPTARFSRRHSDWPAAPRLRLRRVVSLADGHVVGLVAESERAFEDRARFGPGGDCESIPDVPETPHAADALATAIETAAAEARVTSNDARPISISVPMAALMEPDLVDVCRDAVARATLCPQEVCLEIADSALLHRGRDLFQVVRDFRASGFRVGIDARRTWDAPLSDGLRMLLETVTVRKRSLVRSPSLEESVADAEASGMAVMVEGARWQDGPWLARLGVHHAICPATDA